MTQLNHYRECLLRSPTTRPLPQRAGPLGDFFCLGHGLVNSFQSALFSASTFFPYQFNKPCALNCYAPMPFARGPWSSWSTRASEPHRQYFYVDYETLEQLPPDTGYFHAEFRRANPFGGWGPRSRSTRRRDVVNLERQAWDNNYVILETQGRGHYIGCNLSVTNFTRTWWGEGDDMIWVDGYKWPPDLHGTGSEDYFNQAWGMQPNAFLRNGSSIFEGGTIPARDRTVPRHATPSVFHQRHIDGCCDHREGIVDEDLHRHAAENLAQADALLFGRVTYEMMEAAWRPPAQTGARPDWMEPFARTIDAAKKYVVSSTLERVDWNAELVRGDLGKAVQQLKQEPGKGLFVGGVKLPLALAELGLIDEYEFVVHPRLAGHGPTLFAGLSKRIDLKLVSRLEFGSGAVAMRYEPRR
jgi:dihydrofolate reductase